MLSRLRGELSKDALLGTLLIKFVADKSFIGDGTSPTTLADRDFYSASAESSHSQVNGPTGHAHYKSPLSVGCRLHCLKDEAEVE